MSLSVTAGGSIRRARFAESQPLPSAASPPVFTFPVEVGLLKQLQCSDAKHVLLANRLVF